MSKETTPNHLLTAKQQAQIENALSGYGEQGANGYDLSQFRENLRRTPTERLERLQTAVNFFAEVDRIRSTHIRKID